jgi:hypothetical protein
MAAVVQDRLANADYTFERSPDGYVVWCYYGKRAHYWGLSRLGIRKESTEIDYAI